MILQHFDIVCVGNVRYLSASYWAQEERQFDKLDGMNRYAGEALRGTVLVNRRYPTRAIEMNRARKRLPNTAKVLDLNRPKEYCSYTIINTKMN